MNLEKHIYTSSNNYSFRNILKASLKGYRDSFYLAKQLAKRDIQAQYRQSFLGIFWAIFPLLINSLVWIFLQSSGTIKVTTTNIPYPAFVLIGTTLWGIIGECINLTSASVNANQSIITKINFDKEALITLGILKFLFNFFIKIGLIILFLIFFKIVPTIEILFFIPLLFLTIVFFVAVGTLLMPISLLYTDISRLIPIGLQFLMYATPVVYAMPSNGIMRKIMLLNPLSYIITDLRNVLTGYNIENPVFWGVGILVTTILSILALIIYRVSMPILTERMS
ncbi:ABC transporter permease [Flavobacterium sp. 5]|uniref:ABC transporter permease n=1 Tax=Flavobacterium sp. 5 TaxID=2035199 RepID=UPI000C2B7F8D|nr:ABC transporter permease [Flavobacterium sp. 5]PKB17446.1 lipopolysaccharide transport system permease protein [Flavobacterium sp. 5]